MKFNKIAMLTAIAGIFSATAVTAAPVTGSAGTELHWDGKIPFEFADEGVILTALHGTPLTEALKGGDLYLQKDGTFESSSINLELHYRKCDTSGVITSDGTCDTSAGGSWVPGDDAAAIGDLIKDSKWSLMNNRFQVGGRENAELAASGEIRMDGTKIEVGGAAVASTIGTAVFTTANATAPAAVPAATTKYSVFASIIASTGI
ncbi:TPA: hypothetical protein ACX6QC_002688 [Photobacterium damselae]